ncbi:MULTISPECIES: flagellar motor switch protein FliM [Fictibacillus]|uniref:Flagellar motor switch protein FliM n=1 Tax=Fictibacillus enclensis TaxID=1017270 RepID=A0A0V8JDI2_9BACL|nr:MULTISPECIES: flagellar motor switch protein FliM [Fictibacillus]KSU85077.1 flagellar motor switch protein FliM [Fictibacillus enclensis]RXY99264.1 flagellar motor switch protein FliM [Fictibacillus sp. S7]SCB90575.1 flagellar motor switch protein FliM [Fictibacillus enclensis]
MSEVLSQNEIDALLSAISTGEMDAEELRREEKEQRIKTYDFKRALRFSKDQIRSLTRVHENFARLLTTFFAAQLRTYVEISVVSVDQLPYEEFIRSIPRMTILNIVDAKPLDGSLLVEVNPNIAYSMMDRLMGGWGASVNKVTHLTEIETRILSRLFKNALSTYKEAWSNVVELDFAVIDFEVNPQFLQMVSPNETVVVISLSTTVGETSGMMNVCLPQVLLDPIISKLSVHNWMQNSQKELLPEEAALIEQKIRKTPLPVSVQLGSASMNVEEFLQLNAGDIIQLNKKINQPLAVYVENNKKFMAQPGKAKNRMAVQILEQIEGDE